MAISTDEAGEVKFKRSTTEGINALPVENGSLIYNVDNGKTYMDYNGNRIQTGGNADTMIAIGDEEPTDEDIKIWINTDTSNTKASEIVDEYTESDKVGYSCNYLNNNISNAKVLWTNPNPTADFTDQDITLSSGDYDVLEFYYRSDTYGNRAQSLRVLKGYGIEFDMFSTTTATRTWRRRAAYISDTKYHFDTCIQLEHEQTTTTHNEYCVPLYIVGYKTGLFS